MWPTVPVAWLRATGTALADLVLGRCCAGCESPGTHLCEECARALCPAVRVRTPLRLDDVAPGLSIPVFTPLDYSGICRHVLYRFKDHGDMSVAPALAGALRAALTSSGPLCSTTPRWAIPIPSRAAAHRTRGFTPIERILRQAVHGTEIGITHLLTDTRTARADKRLGGADRHAVVAGAFDVRPTTVLGPSVVVDDVVTTGATMREAVATLLHAGVHVVAGIAIAGTPSVGVGR